MTGITLVIVKLVPRLAAFIRKPSEPGNWGPGIAIAIAPLRLGCCAIRIDMQNDVRPQAKVIRYIVNVQHFYPPFTRILHLYLHCQI